jgi:hypothetical protein
MANLLHLSTAGRLALNVTFEPAWIRLVTRSGGQMSKIDDAADKVKNATDKTAQAIKDTAKDAGQKIKNAGDKIKQQGR